MDNKIKKLPKELKEHLYSPLPQEAIAPHPTKSYLSTIKAIYVVERLNEVFGIGGWSHDTELMHFDPTKNIVVLKGTLAIPGYGIKIIQYGGNNNQDLGDSFKGAMTDSLTKCASYLGIGIDVYKGQHKPNVRQKTVYNNTVKPLKSTLSELNKIQQEVNSNTNDHKCKLCGAKMLVSKYNPNEYYCSNYRTNNCSFRLKT